MRPGDDDALDRLESCHRRHDEEIPALIEAARRGDEAAVEGALDFLDRSTPRHFADEEESFFPRALARAPEHAGAIAALVAEHREQEKLHARLRVRFDAGDLPAVLAEAEALIALHRRHVAAEDALFPKLAEILGGDELAAIAAEMQGRRGRR
jgi:hemerythrin-like domain-containing protein